MIDTSNIWNSFFPDELCISQIIRETRVQIYM